MDFDTANDVVRRLRRLAIAQRGRKSELLNAVGLKPGQDVILLELSRLGQAGQLELANASEVDEPSVCRSLARLERQGLVERVVDPSDARR
ncbi:MAG: winged helix-turn-helix transcriptional regulator, partial [Thermoleophilaceae bacterium]|nr:winged helix-turn-helix transcriptional regulator [Thermoleophilaceae bacterium]